MKIRLSFVTFSERSLQIISRDRTSFPCDEVHFCHSFGGGSFNHIRRGFDRFFEIQKTKDEPKLSFCGTGVLQPSKKLERKLSTSTSFEKGKISSFESLHESKFVKYRVILELQCSYSFRNRILQQFHYTFVLYYL